MMVRIDRDLCTGQQLCVVFAPEVFGSDDEGFAVLVDGGLEGEVPAGLEQQATNAIESCPEAAITIE